MARLDPAFRGLVDLFDNWQAGRTLALLAVAGGEQGVLVGFGLHGRPGWSVSAQGRLGDGPTLAAAAEAALVACLSGKVRGATLADVFAAEPETDDDRAAASVLDDALDKGAE